MNKYYGKYRGKVATNTDPLMQGRLQVTVPSVLGDGQLSWAMPCVPFAGAGLGFYFIPAVDANVWVEFEGGDPDYPIWSGCFWATGELPSDAVLPSTRLIKTDGISLLIDDLPGGGSFTIEVGPPTVSMAMKLVFDASGIELTNGIAKIKLSGPNISLNDGALEVI